MPRLLTYNEMVSRLADGPVTAWLPAEVALDVYLRMDADTILEAATGMNQMAYGGPKYSLVGQEFSSLTQSKAANAHRFGGPDTADPLIVVDQQTDIPLDALNVDERTQDVWTVVSIYGPTRLITAILRDQVLRVIDAMEREIREIQGLTAAEGRLQSQFSYYVRQVRVWTPPLLLVERAPAALVRQALQIA